MIIYSNTVFFIFFYYSNIPGHAGDNIAVLNIFYNILSRTFFLKYTVDSGREISFNFSSSTAIRIFVDDEVATMLSHQKVIVSLIYKAKNQKSSVFI